MTGLIALTGPNRQSSTVKAQEFEAKPVLTAKVHVKLPKSVLANPLFQLIELRNDREKPLGKKFKILDLRPTQFAVGMMEVDEKIKQVLSFKKKELKSYITESIVPVVRGPNGQLYVVDKHHFLCVCYHLGIRKVNVEIIKDFHSEDMSYAQFWKWMHKTRHAYPFCQFGEGPRKEFYLPRDIRGLADDPYRSIAWFVRKSGAFENTSRNFAEFKWANFFRSKKLLDREGLSGFEKALLKAINLAQSPAARGLPGYGKLNLKAQEKAKDKVRSTVKKVRKNSDVVKNQT